MAKRFIFIILSFILLITYIVISQPKLPTEPTNTRWVKISKDGKSMGIWKGPWKCVWDRENGLVWELKGYYKNIYSNECSFSWFDGEIGTQRQGNCYTQNGYSDTLELINYFNRKNVCGLKGWRLPTHKELKTLINHDAPPNAPRTRKDLFVRTHKAPYWTSDKCIVKDGFFKGKKGAMSVEFMHGKSQCLPYNRALFVRLVTKVPKDWKPEAKTTPKH